MFESSFREGSTSDDTETQDFQRTTVIVEYSFDLLHNILHYLYTDEICFGTDLTSNSECLQETPRLCSAEDIYAIADRMMLEDLKRKAFRFLKITCTVENITARAMSKFARVHEEVGEMYAEFYRENWGEVRSCPAHSQFLSSQLEDDEMDNTELREMFKRYQRVMESPNGTFATSKAD